MDSKTVEVPLVRFTADSRQAVLGPVVRELPLAIMLNGEELVTTLCSPAALDCLTAGILFSEGIIKRRQDIRNISVDESSGVVRVETALGTTDPRRPAFKPLVASGGGKGPSSYGLGADRPRVESATTVSASQVFRLIDDFLKRSPVYLSTRGVHSAALADAQGIAVFHDDIGRHNALDKVFGQCLMEDIPVAGRIVITSGRISSEILLKVAKRGIPILISKAPPTDLGVRLAGELCLTLIIAREKSLSVYSHDWRVVAGD